MVIENGDRLNGRGKIIGLGFQKTGTTSLNRAAAKLGLNMFEGYRAFWELQKMEAEEGREIELHSDEFRSKVWEVLAEVTDFYDGIEDSPSVFFYREFAENYPEAKFVFTTRDVDDWFVSLKNFANDECSPLYRFMYGVDRISTGEARIKEIYTQQTQAVRTYFAGNPNFIEMNIRAEDKWGLLLPHLGDDFFQEPIDRASLGEYPHANPAKSGFTS